MYYTSRIHPDFDNATTPEDHLGFDIIEIKTGKVVDVVFGRKKSNDVLLEWEQGQHTDVQALLGLLIHGYHGTNGHWHVAACHATAAGHVQGSPAWLEATRKKLRHGDLDSPSVVKAFELIMQMFTAQDAKDQALEDSIMDQLDVIWYNKMSERERDAFGDRSHVIAMTREYIRDKDSN